jgi:hypothetical protein
MNKIELMLKNLERHKRTKRKETRRKKGIERK